MSVRWFRHGVEEGNLELAKYAVKFVEKLKKFDVSTGRRLRIREGFCRKVISTGLSQRSERSEGFRVQVQSAGVSLCPHLIANVHR